MASVRTWRINGETHWKIEGRVDDSFEGGPVGAGDRKLVINLGAVIGISSGGVRALERVLIAQRPRAVVLIHVSPAIAVQLNLLPALGALARVESARLPFICVACDAEKSQSVPWRSDAHERYAPTCNCGQTMQLDGLAEHYLPRG
jgi:hypothetical protein